MSNTPPVSFQALAQTAGNPATGGYPYQIRGSDLDKNFVFATLDVDDGLLEQTTGAGGHPQRKLRIPAPGDSSSRQNLSSTGNSMEWLPGVPDGRAEGQFIKWNSASQRWVLFPSDISEANNKKGAFPQWTEQGWNAHGEATQKGQMLRWDDEFNIWVNFAATTEGNFPQWDAENGWEDTGAGTVEGQLIKWDNTEKNWVPGPVGTVNNELLRWNAENEAWESFGRGATDGQLLVAESGGWVPFTEPPATGTHVLGSVNGSLQWIATEEC